MNQVQVSPFEYRRAPIEMDVSAGIVTEAYSPSAPDATFRTT